MGHVQTSHLIPADREKIFRFITDMNNAVEMLGGKISVELPTSLPEMKPQAEFELLLSRYSIAIRFIGRVEQVDAGHKFAYRQVAGFFREWSHVMILDEHDSRHTRLTDIVDYTMPYGLFGALADDLVVRQDIARLLDFRAAKIAAHFEREAVAAPVDAEGGPLEPDAEGGPLEPDAEGGPLEPDAEGGPRVESESHSSATGASR